MGIFDLRVGHLRKVRRTRAGLITDERRQAGVERGRKASTRVSMWSSPPTSPWAIVRSKRSKSSHAQETSAADSDEERRVEFLLDAFSGVSDEDVNVVLDRRGVGAADEAGERVTVQHAHGKHASTQQLMTKEKERVSD